MRGINYKILFFVVSSLIGSGMFFIPYDLQLYDQNCFIGLFLSFLAMMCLGYMLGSIKGSVFSFINTALGDNCGFMVAWVYWFVCCTSTILLLDNMMINLQNIFPVLKNEILSLFIKIFTIIFITQVNYYKNRFQNIFELFLNVFKLVPVLSLFLLCLYYNKIDYTIIQHGLIQQSSILKSIIKFIWCFAGIECVCLLEDNKQNSKNKEILLGVTIVTIIYFLSFLVCFGVLGYKFQTQSPFSEVAYLIFGNYGKQIYSFFIALINFGSLNLWIVGGGEAGYDNYKMGYFPKLFGVKNEHNVNYISLYIAGLMLIPLCFVSSGGLIEKGVDIASSGFLLFYFCFVLSYLIHYNTLFGFLFFLLTIVFFVYNLNFLIINFFIIVISIGFLLKYIFKDYYEDNIKSCE